MGGVLLITAVGWVAVLALAVLARVLHHLLASSFRAVVQVGKLTLGRRAGGLVLGSLVGRRSLAAGHLQAAVLALESLAAGHLRAAVVLALGSGRGHLAPLVARMLLRQDHVERRRAPVAAAPAPARALAHLARARAVPPLASPPQAARPPLASLPRARPRRASRRVRRRSSTQKVALAVCRPAVELSFLKASRAAPVRARA